MKLEGTYTFDAPRDAVWEAFLDPDVLVKALPGTEKLEKVGQNDYKGAIKLKVGPVMGQFQGTVTLSDLKPPESYHMVVNGRGPAGFLKGEGDIKLEAEGDQTVLHYEGTAQVGGRLASVGQRLIDSTSKALTRQALENLHNQIKANQQGERQGTAPVQPAKTVETPTPLPVEGLAPSPPSTEYEPPSQAQFALDIARDVFNDLIPPEKQSTMIAAVLGVLAIFIFSEWWTNRLARRVANYLEKKEVT